MEGLAPGDLDFVQATIFAWIANDLDLVAHYGRRGDEEQAGHHEARAAALSEAAALLEAPADLAGLEQRARTIYSRAGEMGGPFFHKEA